MEECAFISHEGQNKKAEVCHICPSQCINKNAHMIYSEVQKSLHA